MADRNFWGDLIKTLREERRISQRQLAASAMVCRGTLNRVEAGETTATVSFLEKVLHCLGYELDACPFTIPKKPASRDSMPLTRRA